MTRHETQIKEMEGEEYYAFLEWIQKQKIFKTFEEGLDFWAMLKKQAEAKELAIN